MPLVDVRVPHNFRAFCCKLFFVCALWKKVSMDLCC
jgi:hypothetical protein